MEFKHTPVLLAQTVDGLNIRPDGIYVDCTAGGGGHSFAIAEKLSKTGRLIALDRDPDAIMAAGARLAEFPNAAVIHRNYSEIDSVLDELGIGGVDGILMDLGVSSHQLDEESRGFSYHSDAPLDMRMSQSGMSAADLVNTFDEQQLAKIIFEYGEEKFSRRIASTIPPTTSASALTRSRSAFHAASMRPAHSFRYCVGNCAISLLCQVTSA